MLCSFVVAYNKIGYNIGRPQSGPDLTTVGIHQHTIFPFSLLGDLFIV